MKIKIAILGSTGSIGKTTLQIIKWGRTGNGNKKRRNCMKNADKTTMGV